MCALVTITTYFSISLTKYIQVLCKEIYTKYIQVLYKENKTDESINIVS